MIFRPALNSAMAHRQILESAAVGAHFLVEYHNRMNMAVPEPVLSAPKALEAHLTAAADGANVRYEDYEDWLTIISQQAIKLWNPTENAPITKVAQALNQMDRKGWQIDNGLMRAARHSEYPALAHVWQKCRQKWRINKKIH